MFTPSRDATYSKRILPMDTMDDQFGGADFSLEPGSIFQFGSVERLSATPVDGKIHNGIIKKQNTRAFAELIGRGLKDRLVGWKERSKVSVVQVSNHIQAQRVSVQFQDSASLRQNVVSRASISRPANKKPKVCKFADLVAPITVTEELPDASTRQKSPSRSPQCKFMIRVLDNLEKSTHGRHRSVFIDAKKKMSKSPEASTVKISDSQIISEVSRATQIKKKGRFSVLKKPVESRVYMNYPDIIAKPAQYGGRERQRQSIQPVHNNVSRVMTISAFVSPQDSPLNTKRVSKDPGTGARRTISVLASGLEPAGLTNRRLSRKAY